MGLSKDEHGRNPTEMPDLQHFLRISALYREQRVKI